MTLGAWGLGAAVAAGGLGIALALHPRTRPWAAMALRAHAALTLACLALLAAAFLAADFTYRYVWDHTTTATPLAYRLAGVWGGEVGTILLWSAAVGAILLAMLRRGGPSATLHGRAVLLVAATGTFLGLATLLTGVFAPTDAQRVALAPQGRGLADVLLTPLMVIHPPVQFVAYALLVPVGAYALAKWTLPYGTDQAWARHAYAWARPAWFLSTLGLGLGALWAYYVLSFGGYWAWDPVETGNLLPWLALTAFLHAGKQHLRGGGHPLSAPLLAYGAFCLTLFATFATRSGLWVSVHAFTDPTDRFEPDAAARLLAIVDAHLPTRLFLAFLTFALLVGAALFGLHHAWRLPQVPRRVLHAHALAALGLGGVALADPGFAWSLVFQVGALVPAGAGLGLAAALLLGLPPLVVYLASEESGPRPGLTPRVLMGVAVALLVVSLAVAFLVNLQVVNGPDRALFDRRAPFLALPIVTALTLMLALAPLGRRGAWLLAGAGLAGGAVGWLLFPDAQVFALMAPPLVAATLAAVAKLAHVQGRAAPRGLRVAGVLHLAAALLALVMWSNPPTRLAGVALSDAAGAAVGAAGIALATLGLLGSIACFRARGRGLALGGGVALVAALGYGIGALLAAASLPLVARGRAWGAWSWRGEGARLRETGIYLVHLALVLGLLGYAASTYSQEREVLTAVAPDAPFDVGAYTFTPRAPQVETDAAGRIEQLVVPLEATRGGAPAEPAALAFTWQGDHYEGRLHVTRALREDVYLTPLAFRTAEGWVGAESLAGKVGAQEVEALTYTASVLPLMSLLWAGLWVSLVGMGLVLAGSRLVGRGRRFPLAHEEPAPLEAAGSQA